MMICIEARDNISSPICSLYIVFVFVVVQKRKKEKEKYLGETCLCLEPLLSPYPHPSLLLSLVIIVSCRCCQLSNIHSKLFLLQVISAHP